LNILLYYQLIRVDVILELCDRWNPSDTKIC